MCDVAIPNKEIIFVYEKEVLNRTNQNSVSVSISQAIFSGDTKKLQSLLENFMLQSISSMDGANEAFYHGMMLGLCAVLGNRYQVRSNRESGFGLLIFNWLLWFLEFRAFYLNSNIPMMNMWIWMF